MKSPFKQTDPPVQTDYTYQQGASGLPFGQIFPSISISGGTGGVVTGFGADPRFNVNENSMFDNYDASNMIGNSFLRTTGTGSGSSAATGGGGGIDYAGNFTPQMGGQVASGLGGLIQGLVGRGKRRNAQKAAQTEYDKMLAEYKNLDTSNLYADVENKYMDMENTYEDLTVNQQQAEFARQMFQQQQANTMQALSGAAGGSGIAALAQAMANQGQLQAQKASASIGLQESKIGMLQAQGAAKIQQLERAGEAQAEAQRLAGAETARSLQYQLTGTKLGMAQQGLASANQAVAAGDAALYGGVGSLIGVAGQMAMSDRSLKKNIKLIGNSPSGLNIYSFEYINDNIGSGVYRGVMSDEVPSNAVFNSNGYEMVNYAMLDVEFKRIN